MNDDLRAAKVGMRSLYDRQAAWWHKVRQRSLCEAKWLDRMTTTLPSGARILDLGCGTGVPVARHLIQSGFEVTGVDFSQGMIEQARAARPSGDWRVADMRDLPELGAFDAIVSWDAFFHLSTAEQRAILPGLCDRLRQGGAILLTVGPDEGEVGGAVNGEPVYHASLSSDEYKTTLSGFGAMTFVAEDPETRGRSVLLATGRL
ncbi:MAG: class I SAM-dependent methyltransferase [Pseudomonadota bacterium]